MTINEAIKISEKMTEMFINIDKENISEFCNEFHEILIRNIENIDENRLYIDVFNINEEGAHIDIYYNNFYNFTEVLYNIIINSNKYNEKFKFMERNKIINEENKTIDYKDYNIIYQYI